MDHQDSKWDEELNMLKSLLHTHDLVETVKWGIPVFTHNNRNILGISGFKSYVGIWFYNGAFLKDSAEVLVNAQEGITKAMRQWRFKSTQEIVENETLIHAYIDQAIANDVAGIAMKPQKKETVISEFFQSALDNDTALATAFAKFSPFKQREFLEYVATAKREETRKKRLEKVIPMVLENIGLNDKYR